MPVTLEDVPILETERLRLRPPTPEDVPAATGFYASKRSKYAGGDVPEFRAWSNAVALLGHWAVRGYGLWTVTAKDSGAALGFVGPYNPDGWPETEIGWLLLEGSEGKGIAYEAAIAARSHAQNVLDWTDIVSYIAPENERSIKLAEKLGAVLDPNAVVPKPDDPCLVYRHPRSAA